MPTNDDKWQVARRKALDYADKLTDEEDAHITAAALADPDAQPWTGEMWARAVTFDEWQQRRAQARKTAVEVSPDDKLCIDADVLEHFRRTGQGWQGRINEALRKAAGLS